MRTKGARFAYVKATGVHRLPQSPPRPAVPGSTTREAGLVRGAHHFALPDRPSGRARAAPFARRAVTGPQTAWTPPPALDIAYDPYDEKHGRYGPSRAGVADWIESFGNGTERLTGRRPVIHTTTHWWIGVIGDSGASPPSHQADRPIRRRGHGHAAGRAAPPGPCDGTGRRRLPASDGNLFDGSPDGLKRFTEGA
ncbi:GH25 family lysozyme [Streptomyces sp. NPDC092370]|uniref:GH25 family lysozyme n=1 Tax=Streptomyces sp. NPDC092370 TaxID=3366016 RepID=UPI0037F16C12